MSLEFKHISHAFGGTPVLKGIELTARAGEITCLLGPSGCGKTTLLRLAAGLLGLQKGEIFLNGTCLARPGDEPAPEHRPMGLVFQEGALFPHMRVDQNIAFGLSGDKSDISARVNTWLERVGLSGLGGRYPHELSGGQRQRAALARSLAPSPHVVLMDEPFANIDMALRRTLREDTRRIIADVGAVAILVTHDPAEALDIADHIAILDHGVIRQAGTPHAIYDRPVSAAIASLFGDGQIISARRADDQVITAFGAWPVSCFNSMPDGASITCVIRPSDMNITTADEDTLKVIDTRFNGLVQMVYVQAPDGAVLRVCASRETRYARGQSVHLTPHTASVFAFNPLM